MRIALLILTLLSVGAAWGQKSLQTLVERLNLDAVAALTIVSAEGDATRASYRLVSQRGVRPVLGALETKLLAEGWVSHPNLSDGEAPPNALLPDVRGRQLRTFAQGRELLEVLASPVGRSNFVSLRFNLISAEPERPVAGLPNPSL